MPEPPSVAPVALLFPRVTVVVVAGAFPEAGLVVVTELDSAHPLRALPEVQVRDEQPRRTAVLGLEGLAVEFIGDPGAATRHILQGKVGRVAAVAPRRDVLALGLNPAKERVERHSRPRGIELGPLGNAMDVNGERLRR